MRKDHDGAEAMYKRAIDADPKHANNLGNYTRLLLANGRIAEGLQTLDRAIAASRNTAPAALTGELWMYAACHWLPDRWREALGALKDLIQKQGIRTRDWGFEGVIASATARSHPAAQWLKPLGEVCAGRADPSTLDGWEDWVREP